MRWGCGHCQILGLEYVPGYGPSSTISGRADFDGPDGTKQLVDRLIDLGNESKKKHLGTGLKHRASNVISYYLTNKRSLHVRSQSLEIPTLIGEK